MEQRKSAKQEPIDEISRDLQRGSTFVIVTTPTRLVEFEFADEEHVLELMRCWYYMQATYPKRQQLIAAMHAYETCGNAFLHEWRTRVRIKRSSNHNTLDHTVKPVQAIGKY